MAKRVMILGTCGIQVDEKALKAVVQFVSDAQPDEIVGTDYQSTPLLVESLRGVYDGPLGIHGSRGGDDSFDEILSRFGARLLPECYRVAPGWISAIKPPAVPDSRIAGSTALNIARKFNASVVLGHTGRMGIGSHTFGFGGAADKIVTGMEVGNLMDIRKLRSRTKTGNVVGRALSATLREMSLQQGFGMLVTGQDCDCEYTRVTPCHNWAEDGQHVRPLGVPIHRGRFTVGGHTWEV